MKPLSASTRYETGCLLAEEEEEDEDENVSTEVTCGRVWRVCTLDYRNRFVCITLSNVLKPFHLLRVKKVLNSLFRRL